MVKVEKISQKVTPFGKISFEHDMFHRFGLRKLIDKELEMRCSICGYTYVSLWGNWFDLFLWRRLCRRYRGSSARIPCRPYRTTGFAKPIPFFIA